MSGTVASQEDEEGVLRLYFDAGRRDVSVLLVRSLFVTWPNYVGRDITAAGKVRRFRDQVEIVVAHPRAIEIGGVEIPSSAAPPSPTAARSPAVHDSTPAPDRTPENEEAEHLRRQIERLEQRVRELEGRGD